MFKILIGIGLGSVLAELFLSGTKSKKYVRAVLGVISFAILLEGIFSLKLTIDTSVIDKAESLAEMTISQTEMQIVETYEKNIKAELENNGLSVKNVKVYCDSNLTIKKIIVTADLKSKERIYEIMREKFGLTDEFIELKGEE